MMAAFLIPLCGLAGSAVDMGRLYVTKVRLQQACDAGALAGRKFMADSDDTTLDSNAITQARTFFANNFTSGFMGTPTFTATTNPYPFVPTKTSDNQVAGTATTAVPMTIMKMFGSPTITLKVTCEARYDIADTDVMFVLDTTGSMACQPSQTSGCSATIGSYTRPDGTTGYYNQEVSGSKLSGLRSAVMNFYDTIAQNVDPSTHVRYGFVTYTSTVNAGYALPAGSMVNDWTYNSRRIIGDANNGGATTQTKKPMTKAACDAAASGRSPATGYTTNGQATLVTTAYAASDSSCVITTQPLKPNWRYTKVSYDVSQYVTGATVPDPSKITGATSKWQGCIEERDTTPGVSTFDQDNLPADLDPDRLPTTNATRWRPMWPDVVYYRGNTTSVDYAGNSANPYGDSTSTIQFGQYTALGNYNNIAYGYVSCGKPVSRLTTMSRSEVSNYVNATDFKPQGGTYHDTGMIWGTRMIAPKGVFADDTAEWPGRNAPNRYIVFMTDGDMSPNEQIYGMYGIEYYDDRIANNTTSPSLTAYHNARFVAECQAAKARNITVFVVGFGQTLTSQLTACASPGQAYYASDNASLTAAFQKIAKQVAMLRISQ